MNALSSSGHLRFMRTCQSGSARRLPMRHRRKLMSHKNWIRKHAAFLVFIAASPLTVAAVAAAQQPQQPTGPMAPEKYKNIQVLTNVPADQLDLTMRYVSAAVGLPCVSCHVQDASTGEFAYEKDDKRNKQTARTMMKMVNAINA